jgi:energy-coupling factor transporter ATP-binding protein EcfA2
MAVNSSKTVRLLDDLPATLDAFGGHARVANAILELVSCEAGGRAVALTGPWGSGKSTVVHLLRNSARYASPKQLIDVFVFDAWAHEGDPLRRTFLERLTDFLLRHNRVTPAVWCDKMKEMSRRRKQAEVTSTPRFTGIGVAVLICLYLAPLALLVLNNLHYLDWKKRGLALGISLYLAPLVIVCLSVLWRGAAHGHGLLSMLVNKVVETVRTESIESPEPTSVEFQEYFNLLMSEALKPENNNVLVLVIDNLDRVDIPDALRLWSSMRAFLDFLGGRSA